MRDKIISVIVPLFNTERYIKRCLDSILKQTYSSLEIIVVDDHSTDNGPDFAAELAKIDSRIKIIHHEKNMGLFHARVTGVEYATGDYIAFVDSDDFISADFFRVLVEKAEENACDIVIGKVTHEDDQGYRYVHNMYDSIDYGIMEDDEILSAYWEQCGYNFTWHTVWNKLYSKKLWDKALPILKQQDKHLIMTEDFVFSSVLMNFAERLSAVEYGCYYYFQHSGASTSVGVDKKKLEKNINDLKTAFDFVESVICSKEYRLDVKDNFIKWKQLYKFFWKRNVENSGLSEKHKSEMLYLLEENMPNIEPTGKFPDYFYHVTTAYDGRYNTLTELICSDNVECVSFDIFDTALVRPFYDPHDLFAVLNKDYAALVPNDKRDFSKIRDAAEEQARKKLIYCELPVKEEITINDIYDEIVASFAVSRGVADKLIALEKKAELRFCKKRSSAFNLYKLALFCGKKVFFTTDIYFDSGFMQELLQKNGYAEYDGLLVSSDENLSKRTGSLFGLLKSRAGCKAENILHIGDNWNSDIITAKSAGLETFFFAKCTDCILYNIPDIKTTHSCGPYKEPSGNMAYYKKALGFLGNRTALALAAIKLYDNPFKSYNEWSEANASPQFFGYYMLGMHLLGFVKWFTESAIVQGYDTLAFISRDGWLPMKAYEILSRFYKNAPSSGYIYMSRKAAIPCAIKDKTDLYSLYDCINPQKCTPNDLAKMMEPVLTDYSPEIYEAKGIKTDEPIGSKEKFFDFIGILYEKHFSREKTDRFTSELKNYFEQLLKGKSAVVDIGYSGRTQEMLTKTLGRPVDAFYVHTHDEACCARERKFGFKVNSFYDFTPAITGAVRELMFSQYAPSCVGYEPSGKGNITPAFEPFEDIYPLKYLVEQFQSSALRMIEDFCDKFGDYMDIMTMRNMEVSYPFEYFLHTLTDSDAWMFECVEFEDDLWAGGVISLSEQWKKDIRYHKVKAYYLLDKPELSEEQLAYELFEKSGVSKRNKLRKALFWFGVDKRIFIDKLKKKFKR